MVDLPLFVHCTSGNIATPDITWWTVVSLLSVQQASKPKKKKSVRFADMEYEESESSVEPSDDSENDENKRFFITSTKDGETPVTKGSHLTYTFFCA